MSGRILDPVVTDIAAEFGMPVSAIALLATAYAVPFAIAQPILGPLGDLFSKTLIIKASVMLLVLFGAIAALATNFEIQLVARVLAGAAGAGIVPIGFALIGDRIPLAKRQIAISRFVAATLIGQLVGAAIAGMLASIFGWRNVLWLVTSITLAIAAGAIGILRSGEPARSRGLSWLL